MAPAAAGLEAGISLGFVDQPAPTDTTGQSHGLPVCVAAEVAASLDGAHIDVDTAGTDAQLVLVLAT